MRTKKGFKKLSLGKHTIANLELKGMNMVMVGGAGVVVSIHHQICGTEKGGGGGSCCGDCSFTCVSLCDTCISTCNQYTCDGDTCQVTCNAPGNG